jgi:biopolymer transport protein ExbD
MAIKRSSKISSSFSSSSMTDLVFLLLVFFVLATTLINPINALHVTLPTSSSNKTQDTSTASVKIDHIDGVVSYKLNNNVDCATLDELRVSLDEHYAVAMKDRSEVTMNVSLHCDKEQTNMQEFVDVATMFQELNTEYRKTSGSTEDKYKMVIATKEK